MGLIGKIALIGIVAVAVLIAVIWDVQNEADKNRPETDKTTNAEEIKKELPKHLSTEKTPSPETPQDQTPAAIEQPEQPGPLEGPGIQTPPDEQPALTPDEPGPSLPETTGEGRKYVIEKNDNLHKIARKFYGDSRYAGVIHLANLDKIPDPDILRVGDEIIIPPREEVLREEPGPGPPAVETYIVDSGDTLTKISRMHYGDDSGVDLIYQANKDKIKDKNMLKPGTTLVIPPMPKKPK